MDIYFQKLDDCAKEPTYATPGDFGCDVIAVSEEEVAPNVWSYGLGIRYKLDRQSLNKQIAEALNVDSNLFYDWVISLNARAKSGIWKRGMILANGVGTLDEFYRGEMKVVFYHVMPNMPRYKVGDAVCQLCVDVAPLIDWIEKEEIPTGTPRGEMGFGEADEKKSQ